MARQTSEQDGDHGIPVDAHGGPTVDPTKNVLDLVDAANKRQDDLRGSIVQRLDAEFKFLSHDLISTKDHIKDLMVAHDKRYEQRYEASQKALEAALIAQKDAVREAFAAQKEAINAALASADRAVSKAENAAERRFEGVNEFRAQLGDQQRTLMPRVEAENRLSAMAEKLSVLEGFRTEVLSRGVGTQQGYGWAIGVIGLVLTVLTIISVGFVLLSRIP
jgi:hypothetical protein